MTSNGPNEKEFAAYNAALDAVQEEIKQRIFEANTIMRFGRANELKALSSWIDEHKEDRS